MSVEALASIELSGGGAFGPGVAATTPVASVPTPTASAVAGPSPDLASGTAASSPIAETQRVSFRDAAIRTEAAPSGPRGLDAIGDKVLNHLDRISRDHVAAGAAVPAEPVRFVDSAALAEHGASPVGATDDARFERQMDLLKASFDHAVEVELAGKTGTGLSSSMNKLMSGS